MITTSETGEPGEEKALAAAMVTCREAALPVIRTILLLLAMQQREEYAPEY